MADFNKGDRIVKMSGVNAGKYGTINSISDSGTLNVTFDGERLPRFCDPERCGKIGLNAKFKVGDRVWFKAPVTGAKMSAKITATLGGEKYGFVDDDGIQGTIEGNAIYPLNSRACNRASVFEYGVGDTVKLRSGRTGEVLAKYVDKNGDIKIDVDLNGTRFTASPEMIDSVVKNSRACNATGDQVIATSGKYKLVYNPLNEGYWFYVGDYGEGMSDANGRPLFGKDKNSVAMAEFKRLVATANSRAANATYKLSSREAKVGDLVRVSGMLGTYKVTKINGNELEIVDAEDETYRDRVEARFATPIKNAASDVRAYKLLDDGRAEIDMTTVGWKSRMHSKETLREMEEQAKKESVDTLKRVLATAKGTMLAKLAEKELARRGIKNACRNASLFTIPAIGDRVRVSKYADSHVGEVGEIVGKKGSAGYVVRFKTGKEDNFDRSDLEGPLYGSNACRNASIDDEFPKLKAMGKANAEKYLKDNSQSLIDKYGYPEFVKLAKKIQSIRLKPIKKGRFAGKSGDMTYYVDYTADSMHASRYGKDGTNVTEIQVTGPYVMDPDGKERRHILYYYRSGTESIPAQSSEVRSLVSSIMRGPNVVKQGDAAFAWNACGEDK